MFNFYQKLIPCFLFIAQKKAQTVYGSSVCSLAYRRVIPLQSSCQTPIRQRQSSGKLIPGRLLRQKICCSAGLPNRKKVRTGKDFPADVNVLTSFTSITCTKVWVLSWV
jgi:hypothetical protein